MTMKISTHKQNSKRGFSIIELLISISLFIVVISMAVSIFLRTLKTQKTALLLIEDNNNLAFVVELMSVEMSSGINFCDSGCPLNTIEFSDPMGNRINYALSNGSIIKTITDPDGTVQNQQLTSDSIIITNFKTRLIQNPPAPPRVVLSIKGSPKSDVLKDYAISIQTTVSSRN